MYEVLLVFYLLAAIGVIGLVLVQQGKGADMGASFGAGASNTVFGSGGAANPLSKATAVFATIFFILSLVLGNLSTHNTKAGNEWEDLSQPAAVEKVETATDVPATNNSDIPTN